MVFVAGVLRSSDGGGDWAAWPEWPRAMALVDAGAGVDTGVRRWEGGGSAGAQLSSPSLALSSQNLAA